MKRNKNTAAQLLLEIVKETKNNNTQRTFSDSPSQLQIRGEADQMGNLTQKISMRYGISTNPLRLSSQRVGSRTKKFSLDGRNTVSNNYNLSI